MKPRHFGALSVCAALPVLASFACSGETRVDLLAPVVSEQGGVSGEGAVSGAGAAELGATGGTAGAAGSPAETHLVHRYSFNGEGTRAVDSLGGAEGTLEGGAVLDGAGHAVLDGKKSYIDLPDNLISGSSDTTLFAWLSWNGGGCWQRAFDFGSNDGSSGDVGNATTSLFATPLRCPGTGPATDFQTTERGLGSVDSDDPFPVLQNSSLAVVLDVTNGEIRLYSGGKPLGVSPLVTPSHLNGVNDWLGRSQWVQDPHLRGSYDEFRIYDLAMDDAMVQAVDAAGPEVVNP